jgi:hypothetical protein
MALINKSDKKKKNNKKQKPIGDMQKERAKRGWWYMPLISAFGRQRQVDICEISLVYSQNCRETVSQINK